tara:strand:- start:71288 stop:72292 length:1005 start_codon:yes stop_codon:yes gene_type:complete
MSSIVTTQPTLEDIVAPIKPSMIALDHFIQDQIQEFEPEVQEIARYSFSHQGKRLRPLLVFFSGQTRADVVSEDIIKAAAIVEMIHLASLIHDDILDNAQLRHGCASLSQEYGPNLAVLFGDALFSHALKLATEFPTTHVCQIASQATRNVCSGEIVQTLGTHEPDLSLQRYFRIIDLKTAELFSASCLLGASLAGYEESFMIASAEFGRKLGTAYQIYDDLTDFVSQEKDIGKTLGTDLTEGKYTLPLLLLLQTLSETDAQRWVQSIKAKTANITELCELMHTHGIFMQTQLLCEQVLEDAEKSLQAWHTLPATAPLLQLHTLIHSKLKELPV